MWINTYLGPPDFLITDAGTNLKAAEFVDNARLLSIKVEEVPIEAHHSIGKVEKYHRPVKREYKILAIELPNVAAENVFQMAVKAVNDTAGPDGLVPRLLVFGAYPRMTQTSPPSIGLTQRAEAVKKAMAEIRKLKAKRQVEDALGMRNGPNILDILQLPLTSDREDDDEYNPEANVYVAPRRRDRPRGSKNKPSFAPNLEVQYNGIIFLSDKEKANAALAVRLRKEGKILTPGAPFELSDQAEIEALIGKGVFRFETYNAVKHGKSTMFKARLVHEIKGKGTDKPYEKSRLIVMGYNDMEKQQMLTQSPTIQRASQRIILALMPALCRSTTLFAWLRDITQAYVQSETPLQRQVIAEIPVQIRHMFPPNTIMTIIKPLYGLAESGTHWWATYFRHHCEKLLMETSTFDPCLLVTTKEAPSFGIVGMQTDDTSGLSDEVFAETEDRNLTFKAKPKEFLTADHPLLFNGCKLTLECDDLVL
ncbi:hypothetical protein K3495_g12922 [Podosphaera aphanis]|nr:hypothetical protein K3495_g12922 [Podosphaera aphanis]